MSLRTYKKYPCYVVFFLLTIFFTCAPFSYGVSTAVKYDGEGSGTGEGKNADIALTLVSSSIANGETGVPLDPVIQLDFNKNIVNITVQDNNSKCFHLIDDSGSPVPISLIFPDEQMQSDFKRNVFIVPQENLKKNAKYEIAIDSNLRAKNSTGIDNAHIINFETGNLAVGGKNETLLQLGDDILVFNTALAKTENSVPRGNETAKTEQVQQPAEKKPLDINRLSSILLIVIGAVFVGATLLFFLKKKSGEN